MLNTELPQDLAIPLLGMYTQENWKHAHTETWIWMFIAAILITTTEESIQMSITDREIKCGKSTQWSIIWQ